jgi:predicted secreted hydrolase
MRRVLMIFLGIGIAVGLIFISLAQSPSIATSGRDTAQWLKPSEPNSERFEKVMKPTPFSFPKDFGPHEQYQTEWWYYTGNLETPSQDLFGYQLTIFRRALTPEDRRANTTSSDWHSNQIYFAHFTVSDIAHQAFYPSERFSRGGALGLAGAQTEPYQVWLEDWRIAEQVDGKVHLVARTEKAGIDLFLTQSLPPILQGDRGYSQKGPEPGNASYYYSRVQQPTQGTVTIGEQNFPVTGRSWTDHEYSTSALSEGTQGWDWFSLQFQDGSALMLYELRKQDGSITAESSGTWITADGKTQHLSVGNWQTKVLQTWKSPTTGAEYPALWQIQIPKLALDLTVKPFIPNQELKLSTTYWEGAVQITGQQAQKSVEGRGYVELTGYDRQLQL